MRATSLSLTLLFVFASCSPARYLVVWLVWQTSLAGTRMDSRIRGEGRRAVRMARLEQHMLDLWWNQLGLGDVALWPTWERAWSQHKS